MEFLLGHLLSNKPVVQVSLLWRIGLALSGSAFYYSKEVYSAALSKIRTLAHIPRTR